MPHTDTHQPDATLTLHTPSQTPLTIHTLTLTLTTQTNQLIECRLTFEVNPELYQLIDTQALFNLKSELRSTVKPVEFSPPSNITIEASLHPDILPQLADYNAQEAAAYLQQLCQEQPEHPLLSTESWLALSVKQQQASGEVGYSTLWSYLNPAKISAGETSKEEISAALTNFFQDWTETNLSAITQTATAQIFEGMGNIFPDLPNMNVETVTQATASSRNLVEEMIKFFTADDWTFTKVQGEPMLQMGFQGENGAWTCYARAREQQQQFVFYSICPVNAPENKRPAIAEFITRANYGMMIGNFELDFSDGEIRYKTSIDVEGSSLTFPLIKRLVYANVMMMDEYLPGIRAVIDEEVEVKDAIAQIES